MEARLHSFSDTATYEQQVASHIKLRNFQARIVSSDCKQWEQFLQIHWKINSGEPRMGGPPVWNFSVSPTSPPCNDITTSQNVINACEGLAQKHERKSQIGRNRRRRRHIDTQIKRHYKLWPGYVWYRAEKEVGFCEHINEPTGSTDGR